ECGKEVPESDIVYGPLRGVCKECYENGAYLGTVVKETTTTLAPPSNIDWGNANCDEGVDVSDAVLIARFAVSDADAKMTDQGRRNADVTGDGIVDGFDTTKILKYIAKIITAEELAP
ncbi:MAG: dockerin type I repeat-containing protein, partial [Oscillospiraceae bacterium]|nr:dockerin type I repeat-containing protein [Oscillospiraceae bacterium]